MAKKLSQPSRPHEPKVIIELSIRDASGKRFEKSGVAVAVPDTELSRAALDMLCRAFSARTWEFIVTLEKRGQLRHGKKADQNIEA